MSDTVVAHSGGPQSPELFESRYPAVLFAVAVAFSAVDDLVAGGVKAGGLLVSHSVTSRQNTDPVLHFLT